MSSSIREAAKLFNSKTISALADGDSTLLESVTDSYMRDESNTTVRAFFDRVLEKLSLEYRNEYYFKNIIARRHLIGRHSLKTATMLSEFRVGNSKADCVIFNGKSTCYEIKTEYDSLSRLKEQLADYSKLFDEIYVVCTDKNLQAVLNCTPLHVGVMIVTKNGFLSTKKKAIQKNTLIDRELLIKSLRKEEYSLLAERLIGRVPDTPNSLLFQACYDVIKKSDESLLSKYFIEVVKEKRANNKELIDKLPRSLLNAAISYSLTKKQTNALINIFN